MIRALQATCLFVVLPLLIYMVAGQRGFPLDNLFYAVSAFYAFNALIAIAESLISLGRRRAVNKLGLQPSELPTFTVIVSAYLPNEQEIIVETIDHLLNNLDNADKITQVIVAYNTPDTLPVERKLADMARVSPKLQLLRVNHSRSKAENLNSAIAKATGDVTLLLDADHLPARDSLKKAARWLQNGYVAVQGRNLIRNLKDNLLTRMLGVEFEIMYAIAHGSRSVAWDVAIFGGSNGYWLTHVLQQYRFNREQLTEDIDMTMQVCLDGHHMVFDRSLISTELAPQRLRHLWQQRKRWAHGWFQVMLKYQWRILSAEKVSFSRKTYWSYLLFWGQFLYPVFAMQLFPMIFAMWLLLGEFAVHVDTYLLATIVITAVPGPAQAFVAMLRQAGNIPRRYFLGYAFFNIFYAIFKFFVSLSAIRDVVIGDNRWVVTPRKVKQEGIYER